jgi:hypothetical protein
MGLKAFHIVFIAFAVLMCLSFGVWGLVNYASAGGMATLVLAVVSLLAAVALLIYGPWFLRKMRNVGYL